MGIDTSDMLRLAVSHAKTSFNLNQTTGSLYYHSQRHLSSEPYRWRTHCRRLYQLLIAA